MSSTNTAIKIDHDVPTPSRRGRRIYPFPNMKIGDSFPVSPSQLRSVGVLASVYGQKMKKKFTVREIKKTGTFRCWRLE